MKLLNVLVLLGLLNTTFLFSQTTKKLDLNNLGYPMIIEVPEAATAKDSYGELVITTSEEGSYDINKEFDILIVPQEDNSKSIATIKQELLAHVKDIPAYKYAGASIDEPNGHVYKRTSFGKESYGFFFIKEHNSVKYVFKNNSVAEFSEATAKDIYEKVKAVIYNEPKAEMANYELSEINVNMVAPKGASVDEKIGGQNYTVSKGDNFSVEILVPFDPNTVEGALAKAKEKIVNNESIFVGKFKEFLIEDPDGIVFVTNHFGDNYYFLHIKANGKKVIEFTANGDFDKKDILAMYEASKTSSVTVDTPKTNSASNDNSDDSDESKKGKVKKILKGVGTLILVIGALLLLSA